MVKKYRVILPASLVFALLALMVSPPVSAMDLTGKWEGTPPQGGTLELTLAAKGDEITGNGLIRGGGHKAAHSTVEGKIDGDNIVFRTYFPTRQGTVTYRCKLEEPKLMNCKVGKKYETQFKKVD